MDAFDRLLAKVPENSKHNIDKNLSIANRIISILKKQGKTQRDLAKSLGKSESEISKFLTGLHNFELSTIYKIEVALGEDIITIIDTNFA